MKKLLPAFLFCSAFIALQAQTTTWCPPGATWYFREYQPTYVTGSLDGTVKMTVTGTMTIQNITFQVLDGVFNGQGGLPTGPTQTVPIVSWDRFESYIIGEHNGVLLTSDTLAHRLDTIVNFNASVGDKWLLPRLPFGGSCPSTVPRPLVTVIDTDHVLINGIALKRVKMTFPGSYGTVTLTPVERMLTIAGPLLTYTTTYCVSDAYGPGNFVCYSDDSFPTYNPTNTICDFVPTLGIKELSDGNAALKLYPNPNRGHFDLDLGQPCKVTVYTVAGQAVYSQAYDQAGSAHLDLMQPAPGMYYLSAETSGGRACLKFAVE